MRKDDDYAIFIEGKYIYICIYIYMYVYMYVYMHGHVTHLNHQNNAIEQSWRNPTDNITCNLSTWKYVIGWLIALTLTTPQPLLSDSHNCLSQRHHSIIIHQLFAKNKHSWPRICELWLCSRILVFLLCLLEFCQRSWWCPAISFCFR